ncbi:hypothetical protein [Adhaeribacter soli]|uniref:DUF4292 domain-containing protein n=1 Tax=Adhaeribacter soli TaxID=2607655 RepID=A0A5N1J0T1_9BACT|nr:hypothetical protein [Adhaeribacter soli]KAA9340305.1 hypothetical protein F0P94_08130 [Adhaeribacter soli]
MNKFQVTARLAKPVQLILLFALFTFSGCNSHEIYPAAEGFDEKGSDKKAIKIADEMMEKLGGYQAWEDARFIAWTFFGQYQIWDKKENLVRHEKDNTVSIFHLSQPIGQVFVNGRRIQDQNKTLSKLNQAHIQFLSSAYFLAMPYKLKDAGVTLKYKGEGTTMSGRKADILNLTFKDAGATPDNMHDLYIDKETKLPAQWAFYGSKEDKEPSFVRLWADYKDYKGIKLASNRNSKDDTLSVSHIVVTNMVPKELFLSAVPIDKSKIK